jgi:glucosylceramidase
MTPLLLCAALAILCALMAAPGFAAPRQYHEARLFVTAPPAGDKGTGRLLADCNFDAFDSMEAPDEHDPTIVIDDAMTFQTLLGFGGAFTDASATVFAQLPRKAQEAFLKECFDPVAGNAYTLCRTTIHSCDYSADMYTYDDKPGDKALNAFSIKHDLKERLPFIKRAQAASKGNVRLYASPWSPPAWMKTNGDMLHGGKLKAQYRQTWADYFVKYVQAYAKEGIPMWGLTVQNEAAATQVWESCLYTAEEEKDFVKNYLGPALHKAGLGDVKIMIWDHNRGLIYQRVQPAFTDPEAAKYIWGTAFHWYTGEHFDNVRLVHDAWPDKHLLYTEGGIGGSWRDATNLAKNIILDLNNWTEGWATWNFILDQENGPRHAGGLGGATIVNADTRTGKITYNPPHYVLGQFSRFIRVGAKRIACTSNSDDLVATAALNPDGTVAVVVHNLASHKVFFRVWQRGRFVKFDAPPGATITFILQPA